MNCPQPLTHLSGGAIPFMTIPFIYNQQQQQQQQPSSSFQISLQHPTSSSTSPSFQQMQMSLQQPYHQISLQSPQISLQSPSFQQISLQQPHFQQPMGSPYSTPFTSCSMPSSSSFPSFNNNINCNINAINTNVQSACAPSLFPGIIKETKKQPLLTPTFLKVASPSAVAKVLQEDATESKMTTLLQMSPRFRTATSPSPHKMTTPLQTNNNRLFSPPAKSTQSITPQKTIFANSSSSQSPEAPKITPQPPTQINNANNNKERNESPSLTPPASSDEGSSDGPLRDRKKTGAEKMRDRFFAEAKTAPRAESLQSPNELFKHISPPVTRTHQGTTRNSTSSPPPTPVRETNQTRQSLSPCSSFDSASPFRGEKCQPNIVELFFTQKAQVTQ
eukprot:TRINITY_DN1085_c0_g2_i3.p1 TRINITY_DN1085_c0_g2~~TRINITY_DN1085_c0_g2_i3.p1  ORF type:complete len:390 (+),score=128.64 TRINITY_DN1085_c0_g2_i3:96-1265(+)